MLGGATGFLDELCGASAEVADHYDAQEIRAAIQASVDAYNATATSNAQKIQKFTVLPNDFSPHTTDEAGECSFIYRYSFRESWSQFDSLPLTSLTISSRRGGARSDAQAEAPRYHGTERGAGEVSGRDRRDVRRAQVRW